MAPIVKKVRTAFLFYQSENLQKIRGEMGPETSMGEAMTEVSAKCFQMRRCFDDKNYNKNKTP